MVEVGGRGRPPSRSRKVPPEASSSGPFPLCRKPFFPKLINLTLVLPDTFLLLKLTAEFPQSWKTWKILGILSNH